jgi:hypothetical protein
MTSIKNKCLSLAALLGLTLLGAPNATADDSASSGAISSDSAPAASADAGDGGEQPCDRDATGDGKIDLDDVLSVLIDLGKDCPDAKADCSSDVNLDHHVDLRDLLYVLAHYGETCYDFVAVP